MNIMAQPLFVRNWIDQQIRQREFCLGQRVVIHGVWGHRGKRGWVRTFLRLILNTGYRDMDVVDGCALQLESGEMICIPLRVLRTAEEDSYKNP